ncbi:MAG: DUF3048 domain-containing protein, partial [Chloroflexi bacterium]|nr:DUF3048 domain-containing protein [Chloroflexota bacterium]
MRLIPIMLILAGVLALAAAQPAAADPTLPPGTIGPQDYPPDVNPLTGLPAEDPSFITERRPLLVKVSNAPEIVRPQSGLTHADLVFEHYAEGGWTRFTALYWSQGADRIGSVRSVRLIDLQLAPAFDALVVFSGGSNGVIDTIRAAPIYPFNVISPQFGYGEPYFRRIPREGLPFEHTMFTDTADLWRWVEEQQVRTQTNHSRPGWAFHPVPPPGGVPAAGVLVDYIRTDAEWRYDPTVGQYLRWTDGIPHTDAVNGQQLAFENIIV